MSQTLPLPRFPLPEHRLLWGQLNGVLDNLGKSGYNVPIAALGNATIGQHVRHGVEFYQLLASAITHYDALCYDNRPRLLELETDPDAALAVAEASIAVLESVPPETELTLKAQLSLTEPIVSTNLARELLYLHEHTLHHWAIIAVACRIQFPAVTLPIGFGVAPSTLRAWM